MCVHADIRYLADPITLKCGCGIEADVQNQARTNGSGSRIKNCMLASIPKKEFELLKPELKHVPLRIGERLHEPDKGIRWSYFVNSGLVSLLIGTESGKSVEVGITGHEGMTGAALVAGVKRTTHTAVTEIAGDAYRIPGSVLEKALKSAPELLKMANRFAAIQAMQIAQTAACNRLHGVSQRMARWLLMTDDRVSEKTLCVTHDFLSMMLGTDRPSVTASAIALQKHGVIHYVRGKLEILDRKKLERAVCECYWVIQKFNRELGLA